MNVSLTMRGEIIAMLRILYNSVPKDPEVRALMEENKITHLIDITPSSFEFVIKSAIAALGGDS